MCTGEAAATAQPSPDDDVCMLTTEESDEPGQTKQESWPEKNMGKPIGKVWVFFRCF